MIAVRTDLQSEMDVAQISGPQLQEPNGFWPCGCGSNCGSGEAAERRLNRRPQPETQDAETIDDGGKAVRPGKGVKGGGKDRVGKGMKQSFETSHEKKTRNPSHPTHPSLAVLPAAVVKGPEHNRHQDVGYPGTSAMPCSRTAPLDALVLEVEGRTRQFESLRGLLSPHCDPLLVEGGRRLGKGGREGAGTNHR